MNQKSDYNQSGTMSANPNRESYETSQRESIDVKEKECLSSSIIDLNKMRRIMQALDSSSNQ